MTRRRRRTRTTTEAEVLLNLCHLERNLVVDISKLCHLERNKIIGEAGDLVQSKDPYAVISANGASESSPSDVDVSASIKRTPCKVRGGARAYGLLGLDQTFT